ncbi:hypothetical protein BJP34_24015 [Moorena producens PAL-8-15-08-1]|uniref:Uncharacterized protein n=2 Tax=Moorena TaxID=1155738 RepID=A0A1D8TX09_9CYAN|nr:hypothetical protein BJP34_24015 [Moorena producens PAL-8-15-08-1]
MQMASSLLLGGQSAAVGEMSQWLNRMLSLGTFTGEAANEFGISFTINQGQLTWLVSGNPDSMIPQLSEYLIEVGTSESELERISAAEEKIKPARLGVWISRTEETTNTGWYFPVNIPLSQALAGVEVSQAKQQLTSWASRHKLETCSGLGRSIGVGNPYTELWLPLPGDQIEQQLFLALEGFSALGVPSLPDQALVAILKSSQVGLVLSVWLSATGVVKIGLLVPNPGTRLMLQLWRTAGINQYEVFAAFEGALGVDSPAYVECQFLSKGFGVELHYILDLPTIKSISRSTCSSR